MTLSWPGIPRGRRHVLLCALSATVAIALIAPGGASASNTIRCSGATKLAERSAKTTELAYGFRCNEDITGFTVITNREVSGFEPEVLVTNSPGGAPADGESFGCTGAIPGWGFACPGKAGGGHYVQSEFATSAAACSTKEGRLLPRLVVTDSEGLISAPFALKTPKCPKPKPKKKPHGHGSKPAASRRH